jgi:hypothetical protein
MDVATSEKIVARYDSRERYHQFSPRLVVLGRYQYFEVPQVRFGQLRLWMGL